ncbi:MAG: phosphopyruvate hydratase [Candidatus Puniceispirillaceae bacterium]
MTTIKNLHGRRVWDSRGIPTIEAEITLDNGHMVRAIAPSGASRGSREALELRDGGDHLGGKDVTKAIATLNGPIAQALTGQNPVDQAALDNSLLALDDSLLKQKIGGNCLTAASLACLHAGAAATNRPLWAHIAAIYGTEPVLPLPEIQIFGGGAHAGRRVDIQDFMIMAPGASDFEQAMAMTREVYFAAGDIMARKGKAAGIADEGGWWPLFDSNEEALETLTKAIELAGEVPGKNIVLSLDIAASEFGKDGTYRLALDDSTLNTEQMIDLLARWLASYPIASIEDPLAEDDTKGMQAFTARFGDKVQIIGDDYLVTNANLVSQAITDKAANAVLIKVNQIGTVSQAVSTYQKAKGAFWTAIISARSGETEDATISHLATGLGAGQLKVGSFQRSERMVKWNECLRIQDEIGRHKFAGGTPLAGTWWADQTR